MVQFATQLIERQSGKYDASDLEDRYETRLRAMIDAKLKGEGVDLSADATPEPSNVIDLMAALKKSLGQAPEGSRTAEAQESSPRTRVRRGLSSRSRVERRLRLPKLKKQNRGGSAPEDRLPSVPRGLTYPTPQGRGHNGNRPRSWGGRLRYPPCRNWGTESASSAAAPATRVLQVAKIFRTGRHRWQPWRGGGIRRRTVSSLLSLKSAIRENPRQRQSIASSSLAPPRLGSIGAVDRTVDRLHGLALGANVEPANGSPDIGG